MTLKDRGLCSAWYCWYRAYSSLCLVQRPVYGLFMNKDVAPLFIKMFDRNAHAHPNRNYCYMYFFSAIRVSICVCARINQRKWVWPTFTQLSGHQRPPASSFQMPQLLACHAWENGWGVGGRGIRYWKVDSFFWHHVQTAKRPGLRNYWCGTWNTWKRYSISGNCCACVMKRVSQCRACLGI